MEEDSNLSPSKRRKSLDLKNVMFVKVKVLEKKVIFYILSIFKRTGKKLIGVTVLRYLVGFEWPI